MRTEGKRNEVLRHVAIVAVILLVAGLGMLWERAAKPSRPAAGRASGPVGPVATELRRAGNGGAPRVRLVALVLPNYPPCEDLAPVLESLREKYADRLNVDIVDVWQDAGAAAAYGAQEIPTLIFFDASGRELAQYTGGLSGQEILDKWRELGFDIDPDAGDPDAPTHVPPERSALSDDWL